MMKPIDITIVVPVYNAFPYLQECLDSICAQTYREWKCVLVNDGCTDNSQEIIETYCEKDERFSYLTKENERSADKARYYAYERINSEWVIGIDADDAIEPMFLEKIVKRYWETMADSVSWRCIFCKEDLQGEKWRLPSNKFNMDRVLSGKEVCLLTLGGWQIAGIGMVIRRDVLKIKSGHWMNSDEYNQREVLLLIQKCAFVDAHYYRRQNIGTSDKISIGMFDRTLVDMQLEQFVRKRFPEREDKIIAIAWQRLFNLIYLTADYCIHKYEFSREERKKVWEMLQTSYKALNRQTVHKAAPWHTLMLTHSFNLFVLLATAYVKYKRSHGGTFYYR